MTDKPSGRIANLDGLRAISIAVVFLFHARVPGFGGGFLGVSLFFTLSGYLLGLRLADQALTGATIQRYWMGRVRRLVPLAWVVIVAVVVMEVATDTQVAHASRRLWMTVIGASNWNQLLSDQSYASLFSAPDALVHYWSLGVEQQVYLLLPLVLLVVWRLPSYRSRIAALAGLAVISWLLPFVTGWSVARTYYGTDTRSGEILIGVALALTHQWHRQQVGRPRDLPSRRADLLAGGALALMLIFVVFATPGGDAIRRGLLPAQAIVSVVLVHVAVRRHDLWRSILERRSFVYIGNLSYAIYLVHWPLLILAEQQGWPRPFLAVVVAGASVALSALLVQLIETPFRSGRRDRLLVIAVACAVVSLPVLAAVVPTSGTSAYLEQLERDGAELDFEAIQDAPPAIIATTVPAVVPPSTSDASTPIDSTPIDSTPVDSTPVDSTPVDSTPVDSTPVDSTTVAAPAPTPVRMGIFGDSIALSVALALFHHPLPSTVLVSSATELGCSIMPVPVDDRCGATMANWDVTTAANTLDLAIVMSCQWELVEREIPSIGSKVIGDPEFDDALAASVRSAVQRLLDGGVGVVAWLDCPTFSQTVGWPPEQEMQASRNPSRVARLNEVITSVIAEFGEEAILIDLARWMLPYVEDAGVRPDGSHFAYEPLTPFTESLGLILQPALDSAAAREA